MTLLDKQTHLYKSGLALLLVPFFFACDDPSNLGLQVDERENEFQTEKVEFTLPVSTIGIDSLRTEHFSASLVGKYSDPITGTVEAISYNSYGINGGQLPDQGDSLQFSRAFIRMKIFDSRLNQPLTGESLSIHLAEDTLYSRAVYLADRAIPYDPEPIATFTYDFNPEIDTVLEIPLSDDFGRFLFTRLDRVTNPGGDYADSLTRSLYYYDPLVFVPGADNQGILGFDLASDTSAIYVEMVNSQGTESYYTFDFREAHYNQLNRDRSTGQLNDLSTEYTPSANTGDYSYVDMIAGVYTKVALQPLLDFVELNPEVIVNNSVIELNAITPGSSYIDNLERLQYYFLLDNGRINGPGGQTAASGQYAMLTEGSYLSSGTDVLNAVVDNQLRYRSNITLFSQVLFNNFSNEEDYLTEELVLLSPRTLSLDQTTLVNSEVKLTLYYTSIK